jgi:hypothetical protein
VCTETNLIFAWGHIFTNYRSHRGERKIFSPPFRGIVVGGRVELLGKRGDYSWVGRGRQSSTGRAVGELKRVAREFGSGAPQDPRGEGRVMFQCVPDGAGLVVSPEASS